MWSPAIVLLISLWSLPQPASATSASDFRVCPPKHKRDQCSWFEYRVEFGHRNKCAFIYLSLREYLPCIPFHSFTLDFCRIRVFIGTIDLIWIITSLLSDLCYNNLLLLHVANAISTLPPCVSQLKPSRGRGGGGIITSLPLEAFIVKHWNEVLSLPQHISANKSPYHDCPL